MTLNIASHSAVTLPSGLRFPYRPTTHYASGVSLTSPERQADPAIARVLAPMTTVERRRALLGQLDRGIAISAEHHLDVPSAAATARAQGLLSKLVIAVLDASVFEVFVADDGTIEITASPPDMLITIDVSPGTGRIAMVAQELAGVVVWSSEDATDTDVVRQVERAV